MCKYSSLCYSAPSSAPQNFQSTAIAETNITVEWSTVPCIDRNSVITGYMLQTESSHYNYDKEETIPGTGGEDGTYTITGLTPLTSYYIKLAAVSDSGTGPFTHTLSTMTIPYRKNTSTGLNCLFIYFKQESPISWSTQTDITFSCNPIQPQMIQW